MQLRIAPELYLKVLIIKHARLSSLLTVLYGLQQLVIGGMDRVYEIGKQFRNEGIDADHNPEFTTCEFYQAYGNLETLFDDTETLLRGAYMLVQSSFPNSNTQLYILRIGLVQKVTGSSSIEIDDFGSISFERPFARINVLDTLESKLNVSLTEILKDNKEGIMTTLWRISSHSSIKREFECSH